MKKEKTLALAALVALSLSVLTACGGTQKNENTTANTTATQATTTEATEKTPAPTEITGAIVAEIQIMSQFEKDTEGTLSLISGLDASTVKSASLWLCGAGAVPDEICVIECNSAEDAKKAVTALNDKVASLMSDFKDYTPVEIYKVEGALVGTKGNYAYLFACADNDKALSIFNGKF